MSMLTRVSFRLGPLKADDDTMTNKELTEWRHLNGGKAVPPRFERVQCVALEPGTMRFLGSAILVRKVPA